jgi:hypothetical protein
VPDWLEIVHQQLAGLMLESDEANNVCEELAGHLEETYRALLANGVPEDVATGRTLQEVTSWRVLQRKIESAREKESPMPKRVAQFWFPALSTLLLSAALLALIQVHGPKPWALRSTGFHLRMIPVAVIYFSWLISLPFIGAMGAYLSRRAGGSARVVIAAVVFPVLPYLAFFAIGLPVAAILDDHVAHNITIPAFFVGLFAWVIFPGATLLVGGWPVHHFSSRLAFRRMSNG